jgi:hypothetical protein
MVRDPHCEFLHLLEGPGRLSGSRVAFLTNDLIGSIILDHAVGQGPKIGA